MKLLLHTCCAPCLIYPIERLRQNGFEVTGFFYNPNIHPFAEYNRRKEAIEALLSDIEIIYPKYNPLEYFQAINLKEAKPQRCIMCWSIRIKETARTAKEKRFTHFSTTLLVSPYQDQELLKKIGDDISKEVGVDFYYEDFRTGFRDAHAKAKAKGIYCQKYCGCIYSEIERYNNQQCKQLAKH